jgi:hypothetical protein
VIRCHSGWYVARASSPERRTRSDAAVPAVTLPALDTPVHSTAISLSHFRAHRPRAGLEPAFHLSGLANEVCRFLSALLAVPIDRRREVVFRRAERLPEVVLKVVISVEEPPTAASATNTALGQDGVADAVVVVRDRFRRIEVESVRGLDRAHTSTV